MEIDFSEPQVVVSIGKPKRGKSNDVKYFTLKNALEKKIFKYGIVFSGTSFNSDYDYIPSQYVYHRFDESILQNFIDGVSKLKKKEQCFVVFDDLQGLIQRNDKTILNFISIHRHLKCTIFFNFQCIYGSMPTLRECTTICLMFISKGKRTLEGLFENFGQLFSNLDEFKEYFFALAKEKYVVMLYINDIENVDDNYLHFKSPAMDDKAFDGIQLDYLKKSERVRLQTILKKFINLKS